MNSPSQLIVPGIYGLTVRTLRMGLRMKSCWLLTHGDDRICTFSKTLSRGISSQ